MVNVQSRELTNPGSYSTSFLTTSKHPFLFKETR